MRGKLRFCKPGEQNLKRPIELILDLSVVLFIKRIQKSFVRLRQAVLPENWVCDVVPVLPVKQTGTDIATLQTVKQTGLVLADSSCRLSGKAQEGDSVPTLQCVS